jgi:hypothetical protein
MIFDYIMLDYIYFAIGYSRTLFRCKAVPKNRQGTHSMENKRFAPTCTRDVYARLTDAFLQVPQASRKYHSVNQMRLKLYIYIYIYIYIGAW